MPATSTDSQLELDARTVAELERFICDDPYDPRFIYRAVFGAKMRGARRSDTTYGWTCFER